MNPRAIGNESKSVVIPFGFLLTNGCASELYLKKIYVGYKNLSFHGAALKLKPFSLSKHLKRIF